jgi:hypothetical protein
MDGRQITISEHKAGYLPTDKIVWNHYVTKTREEWLSKCARGSADSGAEAHNARKVEAFDTHIAACTRTDTTIWSVATRLGLL